VIARGIDEDLRLAFQPPEGLRVHDPVAIALERRTNTRLLFLLSPSSGLERPNREL
jgi:hypothetical protein